VDCVGLAEAVGNPVAGEVAVGALVAATTGADVGALVVVGPHAASTRPNPERPMTIFIAG
jgi:hypothetical protein